MIIHSRLYPICQISPIGSVSSLMFLFPTLDRQPPLCIFRSSDGYCCLGSSLSCRQNAQGHWTNVSFYKVKLAATFTWPPESLHLQPCALLPHWWLKTRLQSPTRNIPGSRALSQCTAKPSTCVMPVSQPRSKESLFSVSSVWVRTTENARCSLFAHSPCPALVSAPSWQCNAGRSKRELSLFWEAQEAKASSKVPHSKGGPVCSLEPEYAAKLWLRLGI